LKKLIGIGLVLAMMAMVLSAGIVSADGPPEGTINIDMTGNDYSFQVTTQLNDTHDAFGGGAHSSLDMHQTVRYIPSGQWTSDAPDIDRFAEFHGEGSIYAYSEYDSSAQWSWANSELYGYVESDTYGFLGQNLHFDGNWGGVQDVDPWKKQRDMDIRAEGDYLLGVHTRDLRSDDYGFDFWASDSGSSGGLFINTLSTHTEHGSGQWYKPDRLIVDFVFNWEGSPGIVCDWKADTGGNIDVNIDLISDYISGTGTIW